MLQTHAPTLSTAPLHPPRPGCSISPWLPLPQTPSLLRSGVGKRPEGEKRAIVVRCPRSKSPVGAESPAGSRPRAPASRRGDWSLPVPCLLHLVAAVRSRSPFGLLQSPPPPLSYGAIVRRRAVHHKDRHPLAVAPVGRPRSVAATAASPAPLGWLVKVVGSGGSKAPLRGGEIRRPGSWVIDSTRARPMEWSPTSPACTTSASPQQNTLLSILHGPRQWSGQLARRPDGEGAGQQTLLSLADEQ
jgi:hypothetical protein